MRKNEKRTPLRKHTPPKTLKNFSPSSWGDFEKNPTNPTNPTPRRQKRPALGDNADSDRRSLNKTTRLGLARRLHSMASSKLARSPRTSLFEKVGFGVGFGVGFMRTPQTPRERGEGLWHSGQDPATITTTKAPRHQSRHLAVEPPLSRRAATWP